MSQITTSTQTPSLRAEDLTNFYGSETWFRHGLFRQYLYTEGVQYVAEQGEAYWLLDKIFACHAGVEALAHEDFCVWDLKRNDEGQGAKLICTDGNETALYSEAILFTDFPLKSIRLFCQNNVLMLPSEY